MNRAVLQVKTADGQIWVLTERDTIYPAVMALLAGHAEANAKAYRDGYAAGARAAACGICSPGAR